MRTMCFAICLLLVGQGAYGYSYWNHVRHSAVLPGGDIAVRVENPSGAGMENYLLHAGSGIVEEPMLPVADGPSTWEAEAPGPVSVTRYYGFRLLQGESLDLMPVRLADGADPVPQDLSRLAEDPAGDHLFGYTNLDLVDCRVSFSGDRLYAALKNAGGGFPVISGLTFFGYLLGIADPAVSDPDTVFGLMQTYNQPGIISPGLYKITGTGLGNLTRIGDVVVEEFPALNTLMISCELADLMADPYFVSWYDQSDPAFGVAAFTQRITLLGGAQESDRSPGGRCYLRDLAVTPWINHLPQISDFRLEGTGPGAAAEVDYLDSDGNCPVIAEIVFDDTLAFPMYPVTLNYGSTVIYSTEAGIAPLAEDSWTEVLLRFSDDSTNVVEYEPPSNFVPGDDPAAIAGMLGVRIAPNPFRTEVTAEFTLPESGRICAEVWAADGRCVRTLADCTAAAGPCEVTWDGLDGKGIMAPAGIYFLKVSAPGGRQVRKIAMLR